MQGYSGNDLGRFVTTYNSEYSRTDGWDGIVCKLSVQLTTKKKSTQNEIVGGKQFVKEGKSRRGETGQGWKVTKGARERNPKGFFGPKKQSDRYAVSCSKNKGTQTQKLTDRSSRAVEDMWKNKKMQRPNLENLSKVQNTSMYFHSNVFMQLSSKEQKEMRVLVERLARVRELTWKNRLIW